MKQYYKAPLYLFFIFLISLGFSLPARAQTIVCMTTTLGELCMELLESEAPDTARNFLSYVNQGTYRNSFFHVSAQDGPVYVQAGRYADTGGGDLDALQEVFTRAPITNESSISNTRATVAAVPDDPADPDSVTSQFLINVADNSDALDAENGGYTVFARIIGRGMEVVDVLSGLPVVSLDEDGLSRVPVAGQEVPVLDSPRIMIFEASIYDGDISDFEPGGTGDDDGSGSDDGSGDGVDDGSGDDGETPTAGDGETLYEDAVCVDTNMGEFCMELLPEDAPITVENFLNYVDSARYDDTIIHRSVPNFVIQGGGYSSDPLGVEIERDGTIQNEFSLSNVRGTVAMARVGGQVNSATSEWFVNLVNNTQLDNVDGGFTVFAEVISGMSVVDAIGNLQRLNLSGSLGGAFGEVPRVRAIGDEGVVAEDLVLVHRVYVTDVIVDDSDTGSGDGGDSGGATTTAAYSLATRSFTLPVYIGDELYRVIMIQDTEASGIVFSVDTSRIFSLVDIGQDTATMDLDAGTLHIPSVSVGSIIITDVEFDLIEFETLTFRLRNYTRVRE